MEEVSISRSTVSMVKVLTAKGLYYHDDDALINAGEQLYIFNKKKKILETLKKARFIKNNIKALEKQIEFYERNYTNTISTAQYREDLKEVHNLIDKFGTIKREIIGFITETIEKRKIKVTMSPLFLKQLPLYPDEQEALEEREMLDDLE